jgi:hypothetical protein
MLLFDGKDGLFVIFGDSQALTTIVLGLDLLALQGLDAAGPLVLEQIFDVGLHGYSHFSDTIENLLLFLGLIATFSGRNLGIGSTLLESNNQAAACKSQINLVTITGIDVFATLWLLYLSIGSIHEHLVDLGL